MTYLAEPPPTYAEPVVDLHVILLIVLGSLLCAVALFGLFALFIRIAERLSARRHARREAETPPDVSTTADERLYAEGRTPDSDPLLTLVLIGTSLETMLRSDCSEETVESIAHSIHVIGRMDSTVAEAQNHSHIAWKRFRRCMFRSLRHGELSAPAFDLLARHLSDTEVVGAVREGIWLNTLDVATVRETLAQYYTDVETTRILADTMLHIAVQHPVYEAAFMRLVEYSALLLDECARRGTTEATAIRVMETRIDPSLTLG